MTFERTEQSVEGLGEEKGEEEGRGENGTGQNRIGEGGCSRGRLDGLFTRGASRKIRRGEKRREEDKEED